MIEIKNLVVPFVDKNINMTIPKEYNLLQGENGDGKTILLDYISGVKNVKEGNIAGNENIIYINQNIYFSDRLSGWDFLKFSFGIDGKRNIQSFFKMSDTVVSRTHINLLLKNQWGLLSGGEKKFLYALILLSVEREWYILDEPFAFIDKKKKNLLYQLLNKKISEGKGIILTTHEEDEILLKSISNVLKIY